MKIVPSYNNRNRGRLRSKRDAEEKSGVGQTSFFEAFGKEVSKKNQSSVDRLLEDFDEKERRFLDNETLADFNEYKQAVQEILEFISNEGFETRTVNSRRGAGNKEYFLVKKIDEKLKHIALAITSPASRPFSLMKQCEEIRGLIFDFIK